MDVTGGMFAQSPEHDGHADRHTHLAESGHEHHHQRGCGPIDLASGKAVIALTGGDVHAVLPPRIRLEETEEADEAPDPDPGA